jgi:hypothetical protein
LGKELDTEVQASPGIMGDRLLILGEHGTLVTLQAGREFHELGRNLADKFVASPAFANGRFPARGMTNLYCLGPAGAKLAKQPMTYAERGPQICRRKRSSASGANPRR